MKTTFNKLTLANIGRLGAVALVAAAVGLVGCKSSSDRTTGQKIGDRQIAREVSKNLSKDTTFKYDDVKANVYNGTIQLSGFVETPEQRLRAAEVAAKSKGAKQVINQIMLKPTPTGRVTIRDPLGQETGRLMVDTNAPVPHMRNLPSSDTAPQQQGSSSSTEGTNQK